MVIPAAAARLPFQRGRLSNDQVHHELSDFTEWVLVVWNRVLDDHLNSVAFHHSRQYFLERLIKRPGPEHDVRPIAVLTCFHPTTYLGTHPRFE